MPDIPGWVWFLAVLVVVTIVIIIAITTTGGGSGNRVSSGTTTVTAGGTQSGEIGISAAVKEKFRAPAKSNYIDALTAHGWNALVTTYKVPGTVSKYK